MYLYFSNTGVLKEFINDLPLREGSFGVNEIYIYVEDLNVASLVSSDVQYKYAKVNNDSVVYPLTSYGVTFTQLMSVPYSDERDLKYFKYNEQYRFIKLPTEELGEWDALSPNGDTALSVKVNNLVLGIILFNVQNSVITQNINITVSQWNYLLHYLDGFYSDDDIDELLDEKVDKTSGLKQIYATTISGTQTTLPYSDTTVGAGIVQRTAMGQIKVPQTPVADDDAVSKKYTDDSLATLNDNVVHLTGNETISGTKTFNNGIKTDSISSKENNTTMSIFGSAVQTLAQYGIYFIPNRNSGNTYSVKVPTPTINQEPLVLESDLNKAGFKVALSIDSNYDLVVKLLDKNNNVISQSDVDLPLESIIVSATYYDTYTYQGTTYTNVIVIVLSTTSVPTIIPVGDLVSGLVNEQQLNVILEDYATLGGNNTFTGDNVFDNLSAETITGSYVWFTNLGSDEGGTFAHYDDDYYDYDIRKLSSIAFHGALDDLVFAQGYNPDFPDSHNFTQIKLLNIATPTNATDGANKGYVDTGLSAKQDALVSGTNIKTINNESILGSGNITIEGGTPTFATNQQIDALFN